MFSKKLGVCFATGGPGALNESTGLSRTPDSQAMFSATTKKSVIPEDPRDAIPLLEEFCKGFVENFKAENKPLLMVGYGCIRSTQKTFRKN